MRKEKPRRRKRRIFFWSFLGLILVFVVYRGTLRAMVGSKMAELRKAGIPVTLDELEAKFPRPPASENRALHYMKIFKKVTTGRLPDPDLPHPGQGPFPEPNEPISEPMRLAIHAFLKSEATTLQELDAVPQLPRSSYIEPWKDNDGYFQCAPVVMIRRCARIYQLKAMLAAEEGRMEDAADALQGLFRLADSCSEDPTMIGLNVRFAILAMGFEAMTHVLSRGDLSDRRLLDIDTQLKRFDRIKTYREAMITDVTWVLHMYQTMELSKIYPMYRMGSMGRTPTPPMPDFLYSFLGVRDLDLLRYADQAEKMVSAVGHSLTTSLPRVRSLSNHQPAYAIVAQVTIWNFHSFLSLQSDASAKIGAGRTAMAIERFRRKNGKIPDRLNELVPEFLPSIPEDPSVGKPIQYHVKSGAYAVYGLGENRKDDGGFGWEDAGVAVHR